MAGRPDPFPHNMCVSEDLERRFPWVVVGATSMLGGRSRLKSMRIDLECRGYCVKISYLLIEFHEY